MKLFYKKDYEWSLVKINELMKRNENLRDVCNKAINKLENENNCLTVENNNLLTQNRLLNSKEEKLQAKINELTAKIKVLEDKLAHSYTLKKVSPGRPIKKQAMKIKASVASKPVVRKYINEEFSNEEF